MLHSLRLRLWLQMSMQRCLAQQVLLSSLGWRDGSVVLLSMACLQL
jgi:hypothetical protein